jgi:dihydroorotate dehydrogenase
MWSLLRPVLFCLEPERAHSLSMDLFAATMAFDPLRRFSQHLLGPADPRLRVRCFGLDFPAPLGLAAGFDKDAQWINSLSALGFGFIEVGTITGQPQPGNPKPRVFRLPRDRALINRFGFNNQGAAAVAQKLAKQHIQPLVGINLGKSRVVPNNQAAGDYLFSLEQLYPLGRFFVVNVSSPNTPGLRDLQERGPLTGLLRALTDKSQELASKMGGTPKPILLKIAPDLNDGQLADLVALTEEVPIAGLVATNTTVGREGLRTPADQVAKMGAGGLSGGPLTLRSRQIVAFLYRRLRKRLPLIGVGGIMTGEDAWQMIRAGASLLQTYTGFIYGGPFFAQNVHRYLSRRLQECGKGTIAEVVGEGADV